jgi:hypothetical protein
MLCCVLGRQLRLSEPAQLQLEAVGERIWLRVCVPVPCVVVECAVQMIIAGGIGCAHSG